VVVLLALISATGWGVSDFFGGVFSKRHGAWVTTVAVQLGALAGTAVAVLLLGGSPTLADWVWGAAAGVGVGAGTAFLYRGLSTGRMGVVAPVSAVGAALVPVLVGVSIGERPGLTAVVGIVIALPAIWLIASTDDAQPRPAIDERGSASTGLLDGVLAGVGFGTVLWAVQAGLLSVVSVLVSLYPAVTVALAAALLREHIHRAQAVGLGLAAVAVSLISLA
jgi:uncharacterized membrane protein